MPASVAPAAASSRAKASAGARARRAVRALEALVAVSRSAQERGLERLLAVRAGDLVGRLGIVTLRHLLRIAAGFSSSRLLCLSSGGGRPPPSSPAPPRL